MGRLNFNDIADWTPTSISIVDRPDHPLAVFEVYEDDDEFVKKSINIDDNMSNEENMKDETISISQSFFEKLLGRTVMKSAETTDPPAKPPVKSGESEDKSNAEKIIAKLDAMDKKIDSIDKRLTKVETDDKVEEKPDEEEDPVPGTVTKNETTSGNDSGTNEIVDDSQVVTKSREVDPDKITVTKSEKTFYERIGRKSNGMTW